jgi:putative Ca2+/H+ antiporter (TMEM165/GDT1 family)
MGQLLTMFVTIFVAELGDKTQIATLLFASERKDAPLSVFLVCAGALVLGTAIAVSLGAFGGRYMQNVPLKLLAGIGFIVIGIWSLLQYYQGE